MAFRKDGTAFNQAETKIFNGQRYDLTGGFSSTTIFRHISPSSDFSKREAQKLAKEVRSNGCKARIVKSSEAPGRWAVYQRC